LNATLAHNEAFGLSQDSRGIHLNIRLGYGR